LSQYCFTLIYSMHKRTARAFLYIQDMSQVFLVLDLKRRASAEAAAHLRSKIYDKMVCASHFSP